MDHEDVEHWADSFRGDTFVDVGANVGRYAIKFAKNFRHVIALEPWYATCEDLRKNVATAHADNVEVMNAGASSRTRTAPMYGYECGENNSLEQCHPVDGRKHRSDQEQYVLLTTVDAIMASRGRNVSYLKIDTEGHDLDVLQGAIATLRFDRPHVQCEYHRDSDVETIKDLLTQNGYAPYVRHYKKNCGWIMAYGCP